MKTLNVAVLGGGSWGTTVASLVARNTSVTLWARDPATVEDETINNSGVSDIQNTASDNVRVEIR